MLPNEHDITFAKACKELEISARLNAQAVEAVVDLQRMSPDSESAQMCSDSLSFALSQPIHLMRAVQLLALDLELAAARAKV